MVTSYFLFFFRGAENKRSSFNLQLTEKTASKALFRDLFWMHVIYLFRLNYLDIGYWNTLVLELHGLLDRFVYDPVQVC